MSPQPPHWTISSEVPGWDLAASIEAFDRQTDMPAGIKCRADMERYDKIIRETKPDLLIECGTWQGGSARWFAERVPRIFTIDIENRGNWPVVQRDGEDFFVEKNIGFWLGDSSDEMTMWAALAFRGSDRTMVSLDSDHTAAHVAKELALWAPVVTPGCYLVVEDTLLHYRPGTDARFYDMDPLIAVWEFLKTEEGSRFELDTDIEGMFPVTQHPGGWLRAVR